MEERSEISVGMLLRDMGRIGIITRIIKSGALDTQQSLIKWRVNIEIAYCDGSRAILGEEAFHRLIKIGVLELF